MATTVEIEKLAYDLWEKDGRPQGRDQDYYFTAERMLAEQNGHVAVAEAPKKATRTRTAAAKPRATTRTKKQA